MRSILKTATLVGLLICQVLLILGQLGKIDPINAISTTLVWIIAYIFSKEH